MTKQSHRYRTRGLTLTELVVVVGILGVLTSILAPTVVNARKQAHYLQCSSNLRQISQAVVMYDIDINRYYENYPDRMTHLYDLGYITDERLFVCPADTTRALPPSRTLKPGTTADDKSKWAERTTNGAQGTMKQHNSSYLYEFSTIEKQEYDMNAPGEPGVWDFGTFTFPSDFLVGWKSIGWDEDIPDEYWDADVSWEYTTGDLTTYLFSPPVPSRMDRDGYVNGATGKYSITLQEAKFWQMENGDVYTTGLCLPGERGIPEPDGDAWYIYTEPYDQIFSGEAPRQHGYPRTWIPLLRCFWHAKPGTADNEILEQVLNVAVEGNTFYSVPFWEYTAWKYGRAHWEDEDF